MANVAARFLAPLNSGRQYPADRLQAGTKTTLRFEVVERDQVTAFDLAGLVIRFRAKADPRDTSFLVNRAGTIAGASENGEVDVEIEAADFPEPVEVFAELLLEAAGVRVGAVSYGLAVRMGATE